MKDDEGNVRGRERADIIVLMTEYLIQIGGVGWWRRDGVCHE